MKPFRPIIIVAVDEQGGFGKDGKIPWYIPEDLKRFKTITENHICVMGRNTYQEILEARKLRDQQKQITEPIEHVLRNRLSFVVTSNETLDTPGAIKIKNMRDVQQHIPTDDSREIFVIGGQRMFEQALSWCECIHLTVVQGTYNCDVFFPVNVVNKKWHIIAGKKIENAYFVVYSLK